MRITPSPTERTTAATDLLLAAVAGWAAARLLGPAGAHPWPYGVWSAAFGLIALASLLGALAHGLLLPEAAQRPLWRVLNLALGAAVSLFAAGVVFDLAGPAAARRSTAPVLAAAAGFGLASWRRPRLFRLFVFYEAAALLFALAAYGWLAAGGRLAGAGWMAGGVLLSLVGAAIQAAGRLRLKLLWQFDHNGIFHLVQAAGLLMLLCGLTLR